MLALEKYHVGSDTIIKNITKEVIRDCAKQDVHIDESIVSLAVRLLCLDPANGLQLDHHYDRRDLELFVTRCVQKLAGILKRENKKKHCFYLFILI